MKKNIFFALFSAMLLITACQQMEFIPNVKKDVVSVVQGDGFTLVGYTEPQTRTSFGSPVGNSIPFSWSAGDRIGINVQAKLMDGDEVVGYAPEYILSNKLEVSSPSAEFTFPDGSVTCGDVVYYGAQVQNNYDQYADEGEEWTTTIYANVKTEQTGSPEDLGLSGDFGYAEINENNTFTLNHATSYLWLNSYSSTIETMVEGVRITATSKIAGQAEFVDGSLGGGTSLTMSIRFPQPKRLLKESSSTDIWAAAVILPINTAKLTVEYDFVGNTTTTYTYNAKDIKAGNTYRISENVTSTGDAYQLKVLTFEDADAKFTPYTLEYAGVDIATWSDLIDETQYSGDILYSYSQSEGDYYSWTDQNNTFLAHHLPYNYGMYWYAGGGHAISNYVTSDYVTYGNYEYQLTVYNSNTGDDVVFGGGGHNDSDNFCVHFGYMDGSAYNYTEELPSICFSDGTPRVIDHMWVANTAYALNCFGNGNSLTEAIKEGDVVYLTATGYDENGTQVGQCTIYLVNGPDNIVDRWVKWNLSSLGKVSRVDFNVLGTSNNGYGFSQPAYFAYDDVAVRFPISK